MIKVFKKDFSGWLFLIFAFTLAISNISLAAAVNCTDAIGSPGANGLLGIADPSKLNDLSCVVLYAQNIADVLLRLVGAVAVLIVLYGGFLYASNAWFGAISGGKEDSTQKAKNLIIGGLSALVISILLSLIIDFVIKFLGGLNFPTSESPPPTPTPTPGPVPGPDPD